MASKLYHLRCDDFPKFSILIGSASNKEALRQAERLFLEHVHNHGDLMPDKVTVEVDVYDNLVLHSNGSIVNRHPLTTLAIVAHRPEETK